MSASTFTPPPFPPVVPVPDFLLRVAQAYPDREVVLYLQDGASDEEVSTTSVTWRQFLADVWARADYLEDVTGLSPRAAGTERVVVGLLAESNYDFLVDLVAMFMLRWQVLLISVRNSPDAIQHLMQSTGCSAVLVDSGISHLHLDILRKDPATGVTPTVIARPPPPCDDDRCGIDRAAEFLGESVKLSADTLRKEAEGGAIYLHTSGSTGHPKAIAWPHQFILAICASTWRDRARCNDDVLYTCFPLFHAGGICTSFPFFLGSGASFVCVDAWRSVGVDTVLRHLRVLKNRKVDASLPPSMLEELADARDVRGVGILAAQNTVFWGGAPLRENAGNYLVQQGVKLVAWGGSTEAGPLARSSLEEGADPADWMYMRLVDYYDFKWLPMEGDVHSRYNLIVSPVHPTATPPLVNCTDPVGFATSDGWLQHPDPQKARLWRPAGRLDDVTVLSNGEKTDNKQLEELLCASPYISHAIIFGAGKFVNGAIVNPAKGYLKADTDEAIADYLALIWPHIEGQVNKTVPQHSRLLRGMVVVARADRPFLFSDKGTVKTKASLILYAEDVERAYEELERGLASGSAALPLSSSATSPHDEEAVLAFVQATVADALGRELGPSDDFFRNGMDSLVATKLRTALAAAVRNAGLPGAVPRNVAYAHPSCTALTRYLCSLAGPKVETAMESSEAAEAVGDEPEAIDAMIEKYSADFTHHTGTLPLPTDGAVYAVTGTTGSLGAAYVAHLLAQSGVKKVYLLNRGHPNQSMESRQEAAFRDKGLNCEVLHIAAQNGRVEYIEIEVGQKKFGLSDEVHDKLAFELTHIVHNAWLLNFNLFLSSFEPHVAGVRAVIDLALASPHVQPPHVSFISSIGAVARWPFARPVPEAALNSPEFAIPQGYSFSKYVSEQILMSAVAQRPCLRTVIIRCGQLSGSLATGAWAQSEYMPRLLRSADALGLVPSGSNIQPVRWLPVDVAADILFREVLHGSSQSTPGPVRYYSLDNMFYTPWSRVVYALQAFREAKGAARLKEVSMDEFLDAVRADPTSPAFSVADYLEPLLVSSPVPSLDAKQARKAAGNLVDCDIGEDLLGRYVQYACTPVETTSPQPAPGPARESAPTLAVASDSPSVSVSKPGNVERQGLEEVKVVLDYEGADSLSILVPELKAEKPSDRRQSRLVRLVARHAEPVKTSSKSLLTKLSAVSPGKQTFDKMVSRVLQGSRPVFTRRNRRG